MCKRKQVSECCLADIEVMPKEKGDRTRWYECTSCKKPCDAIMAKVREKTI